MELDHKITCTQERIFLHAHNDKKEVISFKLERKLGKKIIFS